MKQSFKKPARMNLRKLSIVSTPLLLLSLGACASSFKSEVARFNQLPAPQGQSFTITSSDPELRGGLEFAQYASLVEDQMRRVGYVPASSSANADLTVSISYDVDNGKVMYRREPGFYDPFYGPAGYGRGYYGRRGYYRYGFYDPFFFGRSSRIDSVTVYTSELDMKIDRNSDGQRLFEGTAEAMSRSKRLQYLVPNLVEAIFTDFPGESGEVVRISIAPEDKRVKRIN